MYSGNDIVDIILSWSIHDIVNSNLLTHKVRNIPTEFSSVNHYLESFRYPLIEEARAAISKCLFALSEAPSIGIIVKSCSISRGSTQNGDTIFTFSLYYGEQRGHYEPKAGDIVLLSTFVPNDYEDLQGGISLAVINETGNDDGHCIAKLGKLGNNAIAGGGASYVAVHLLNVNHMSRVWNSLNVASDPGIINMQLMKKVLSSESLVNEPCSCAALEINSILDEKIVRKLNESQIDAVSSAVLSLRCNHSVSIHCISGLLGTGKSEVASIIAVAALSSKYEVIICVPEKYPLLDSASQFLKAVEGSCNEYNKENIVLYGDNDKEIDECFRLGKCRLIYCHVPRLSSLMQIGTQGVLIVENAFQVKECDLIVPMQLKGLRHIILVGNEYERPATTSSKISRDVGFARSLFERLGSFCPPKKLLPVQYRMHPEISRFPRKRLQKGQLLNGPLLVERIHFKCLLLDHIYKEYSFLDIADGKEVIDGCEDDWKNLVEAAIVVRILMKLFHAYANSGGKLSIGVISPYEAQVRTIQDMIPDKIKSISDFSVWVRSCDEIQNSEVDVVILSSVRCNGSGSVGCLSDPYLSSISLTRARHHLWIVGSGATLLKSQSIWQDLVLDATERGCVFKVGEDKDLSKVVLDVKHELDELEDLLNQESVLFNNTVWKIIFSDIFKQSFVALKSIFTKQIVLGFLLRLASGWRPRRRCLYSLEPPFSNFVKLYKVHGLYLVCTTDIVSDSKFVQALRVWDVLPLLEIPKLLAKLEEMMSVCSQYYKERCMQEKHDGNLVVPISWKICADYDKYNYAPGSQGSSSSPKISNNLDGSKVSESMLLMKFYSLSTLSVNNLLKASDGKEIELPFEVSDHELEILKFSKSSFILGRSGTGKTIVSILKLMQKEREYLDYLDGILPCTYQSYESKSCDSHALEGNGLHQIFVTVSANLCSAVKDYISRLQRSITGEEIQGVADDGEMHEVGDCLAMFSDIPDSFVDLKQSHFPLVLSLHKFLLMLDGSLSFSYFDRFQDLMLISDSIASRKTHAKLQLIRAKEVRFERFLASYWPRFNENYTKNLDPLLVFTQIISFIKGGCRLGKADQYEKMPEEDYINLCDNRKSTLQKEKRKRIYKIFLDYEKRKLVNGEYDISDLVIDIHRRMRIEGYGGTLMDFVYIDEVQDFSLNQLSLFKFISSNVKEGFMFSGDSAQTITKGVDFRFEDIRSLFYTEFIEGSEKVDKLFHLYQNYRTHSAVLKLAQSVLTLLHHFFPYSFDKLESETSILQGELPVLLENCDENILEKIFSSSQYNKESLLTFGAQQVILVRDDLVKKQVIDKIGSNALVLTIIECKGLEFQDVLLYNFFDKSPLGIKWRIVYNFMSHENLLDASSPCYPNFDVDVHGPLCSELKELYVAITRTRQRFWIFETSSNAEPLFDYWKKLGVVKKGVAKQGEFERSFACNVQVFCKPEEWNKRGQKLFNEGNYKTASFCFKRAGDVHRSKWAKAASLQMDGENNLHTDFEMASNCLTRSAGLYGEIGKQDLAVSCFMKCRNYAKAAEIYLAKFPDPRYEDAGDCFALAGLWSDAAKVYAEGNFLFKCLSSCRKGGLFELGWRLLTNWPGNHVADDRKLSFLNDWISKIDKNSDIQSSLELARSIPEDAYSFLLGKGMYLEASRLHRMKGNTLIEADMVGRAKEYKKSSQLMVFHIAVHLLSTDDRSSGVNHPCNLENLFRNAEELAYLESKSCGCSVYAELQFLSDQNCNLKNIVKHLRTAQNVGNFVVETVSARYLLNEYLKVDFNRYRHDPDAVFKWKSRVFENLISEGRISAQVLLNAWNIWIRRISGLFSYLQSSVNTNCYEDYTDLCQKYFKVLKLDGRDVYVAFKCHSTWLDGANEAALYRIDDKVYMSGRIFRSLGQHFLRELVSSLGHKLLQILKQRHKFSQEKKLNFVQGTVLAFQISGLSKFVRKYGRLTPMDVGLGDDFISTSFSPLYYNECMLFVTNDYDLQDKDTAVKAVGLVLYANLNSFNSGYSPTRIAWAIVFLFLWSKLIEEMSWEIRNKYGFDYIWKEFLDEVLNCVNRKCKDTSSLARTFLNTLEPMHPLDQLLLIETLFFLTSSCKVGSGWFVTTKLMLSKSVLSKYSESFHYALSGSSGLSYVSASIDHLFDFMLAVACEILSKRRFLWATRYETKTNNFQKALILRLVSLICLLCLNSDKHFLQVQKILKDLAVGFLVLLPPRFQITIRYMMCGRLPSFKIFVSLFSKALETTENGLVLVRRNEAGKPLTILCKGFADLQKNGPSVKPVGLALHEYLDFLNSGFMPACFGQCMVFPFVSSKLLEELTWEIRYNYGFDDHWKDFLQELLNYKGMDYKDASSLADTFLNTVQSMDPHDQILLMEALFFVTLSCETGNGWFMSTKLKLSKYVSRSSGQSDISQSVCHLFDFILAVVYKMLSKQRFLWARRDQRKTSNFQQTLVLRLVSLLCLICLNSEVHFVKVQKIIKHSAVGFLLLLPPRFQLALRYLVNGSLPLFRVFAFLFSKALETTEKRLVLARQDDSVEAVVFLKTLYRLVITKRDRRQHRKGSLKL